jgi:hypothetical protein
VGVDPARQNVAAAGIDLASRGPKALPSAVMIPPAMPTSERKMSAAVATTALLMAESNSAVGSPCW